MLNELRDLARSLERAGILQEQEDVDPHFRECPKGSKGSMSYWLYLGEGGEVNDIAPLPPDYDVTRVRKWERANGCSFPAFNIPPLYEPKNDENKEKVKNLMKALVKGDCISIDDLEAILAASNSLWNSTKTERVDNCLNRATKEVEEQLGEVPKEYLAIKELCVRTKLLTAETLHSQLKELVIKKLTSGFSPAPDLMDVLFFYAGQNPKDYQVILEIPDWSIIGEYPATHQAVQKWMNSRFLFYGSRSRTSETNERDAFGESAAGKDEKFPPVRMHNALGNVILRAMNKESPCQMRYGMIDADSFPAGNKVRIEMKSALEWLASPERKGKTWSDLTRKMDKAMLLFAYSTERPEAAPELAGLCGIADEDASDPDGAIFAAIAERVIITLRGITDGGRPDTDVRIFVLAKRKGDARTKVLVSRRYTADHMITSAENWQTGCGNIPPIRIRQFGENKGDKPIWAEPLVPFPAELVWCLNTAWRRQGTYPEAVHGFSINDALSLLLDEGFEVHRLASRALDVMTRNSSPLLLAIGQENAFGRVFRVNQKYSKQSRLLPSILGLLLHKIGYRKGEIMDSPAFLVGRLMSLTDQLHLKYCEDIRRGSIPSQLAGNALMATALKEPVKALSLLGRRILPYQSWATRLQGEGQNTGLVKYFLAQLGEVCENLKNLELPSQCSDVDKAQMLLGYLAWPEKRKEEQANE